MRLGSIRIAGWALLTLALLAGCNSPTRETTPAPTADPAGPENQSGNDAELPPAAPHPQSMQNETPPIQAPSIGRVGFHWTECSARSALLILPSTWVRDHVPEEYRLINIPGNLAQVAMHLLSCAAATIGNETYLPGANFSWFGAQVEAPAGSEGPASNVYMFELQSDAAQLVTSAQAAAIPATMASYDFDEGGYRVVAAAGFSASVVEPDAAPVTGNDTSAYRLHWKTQDLRCWMDATELLEYEFDSHIAFSGEGGIAKDVSGPAQSMAGLGSRWSESGYAAAPLCVKLQ